jgi:phage baseplate assembly protein W
LTTNHPDIDFIGRGVAFPMRIDAKGRIALAGGADDIAESMRIILMTAPGERPMRPRFGCRIWDHVFAPLNSSTLAAMGFAVRGALAEWEPRIVVEDVRVTRDPETQGAVQVAVGFRVRATNDRRNLVYPFYVIPEEGAS